MRVTRPLPIEETFESYADGAMPAGWVNTTTNRLVVATLDGQKALHKEPLDTIFKRARGQGKIRAHEGLGPLLAEIGPSVVALDLLPVGSQRRDWLQTLISDGMVILRHPDLETAMYLADRVGTELQLVAS